MQHTAHIEKGPFKASDLPHDPFDKEPLDVAYHFPFPALEKYFAIDQYGTMTNNSLSLFAS